MELKKDFNKIRIRGINIFPFKERKELLDYIENKKKILIAINTEKILKNDPKLKEIINNNIGYPDGIGAVMALHQKGFESIRIPGAELWLNIIARFKNKTYYLIGSNQEIIDQTIKKLKKDFPNIKILGYRNGYFKDGDKEKLIDELKQKRPDIVFVAQGSPRQEFLMNELIREHPALYMGLGGSFDVYTGYKKRAPKFFLDYNLEWLYRLLKEPTRASRQIVLFKFGILYIFKKL